LTKSQVITARISPDLYEKVKYLEINITVVVRDSLIKSVVEREAQIDDFLESLPEMRFIGGLKSDPERNSMLEQIRKSSGEERTLAVIRYLARVDTEARKELPKLIRELELEADKLSGK
jgi:hypothetical protein